MAITEFKWDVTYSNDISSPEKVTTISELIMKYERRGIKWTEMKGELGMYLNKDERVDDKVYGINGEKLNETSIIKLTGRGNLNDFKDLRYEMETRNLRIS